MRSAGPGPSKPIHPTRLPLAALVAAIVISACAKDGANEPIAVLRAAGVEVTAVAPSNAIPGSTCQTGRVDGIEAAVCRFAGEGDAKAAEAAGLAWVGDAESGVSIASGAHLLMLADRSSADPGGKRIDAIAKAFSKR
jgi:hypothetical protein